MSQMTTVNGLWIIYFQSTVCRIDVLQLIKQMFVIKLIRRPIRPVLMEQAWPFDLIWHDLKRLKNFGIFVIFSSDAFYSVSNESLAHILWSTSAEMTILISIGQNDERNIWCQRYLVSLIVRTRDCCVLSWFSKERWFKCRFWRNNRKKNKYNITIHKEKIASFPMYGC